MAAFVAAGCTDPAVETTTTTVTSSTTTTPPRIPEGLEGYETATVVLQFADEDRELLVAIADDAGERAQGLMNVTDLLDLDGMLFVFDADTEGGFWMSDTPLALTLVHFDAAGAFVSAVDMSPCPDGDCPSYLATGPYRLALEVPQGALVDLPAAIVVID
ncbi:MAG: hypothetical protein HKN93_09965 [Acidimicrobiia bacterium]|nr:hypothetical protein [Acidimicrobiia bacterium]